MNAKEIKELATKELQDVLNQCGIDGVFKVVAGGELDSIEDEYFSFEYEVIFNYGNIKRTHNIQIGWNDKDGIGLELGEDCDLYAITNEAVMRSLYFDLALVGLDDKYTN